MRRIGRSRSPVKSDWREFLYDVVRSKLLGPKDMFERSKRRTALFIGAIIACVFITPKFFGFIAATAGGGNLRDSLDVDVLIGISPDDITSTIILAVMLISLAGFLLASNLSYAKFNATLQSKLAQKSQRIQRNASYEMFRSRIFELHRLGESEKARYLIAHIKTTFPDLVDTDAEIVELDYDSTLKLTASDTKLLPSP